MPSLTALVLFFPGNEDRSVTVLPYFWMPADNIAKRERNEGLGVHFTMGKCGLDADRLQLVDALAH